MHTHQGKYDLTVSGWHLIRHEPDCGELRRPAVRNTISPVRGHGPSATWVTYGQVPWKLGPHGDLSSAWTSCDQSPFTAGNCTGVRSRFTGLRTLVPGHCRNHQVLSVPSSKDRSACRLLLHSLKTHRNPETPVTWWQCSPLLFFYPDHSFQVWRIYADNIFLILDTLIFMFFPYSY